jgi:phage baseplate assembly protein W
MVLSPEVDIADGLLDEEVEVETLRTYKIDYETMTITSEIIEGIESIKQFIHMALRTPRYEHQIYSSDYGSEIEALLSDNEVTQEFKQMELPRLITEALIYDDRIDDVTDFDIIQTYDAFHVSFTVHSVEGILEIEEVLE